MSNIDNAPYAQVPPPTDNTKLIIVLLAVALGWFVWKSEHPPVQPAPLINIPDPFLPREPKPEPKKPSNPFGPRPCPGPNCPRGENCPIHNPSK